MPDVAGEVGQTTRSFMRVLEGTPLSLSLVVMNFLLVAYLFYSGSQTLEQRSKTTQMIVDWQRELQPLLGGCISQEATKMMLDNMQRITETMLTAEQREIQRMQEVINQERELNRLLLHPPSAPAPAPRGNLEPSTDVAQNDPPKPPPTQEPAKPAPSPQPGYPRVCTPDNSCLDK